MSTVERKKNTSVFTLIAANMVPLGGVIFFNWSLFLVLFLFWFENVVIGFLNVLKMFKAEGKPSTPKTIIVNNVPQLQTKANTIPFFIFHYGMFTFVHGVFLFVFFVRTANASFLSGALLGMLSLFVSHFVSYRTNYIGRGEYKRATLDGLFLAPYKRIIILHLVVLLGGIAVVSFDGGMYALILLVVLKIVFDTGAHMREHVAFVKK